MNVSDRHSLSLPWFSRVEEVAVCFESDDDSEPSAAQIEAFNAFIEKREAIFCLLQDQLLAYYADVRHGAKEDYDAEYFSKTYPPIDSAQVLSSRIQIRSVLVSYYDEEWSCFIGLLIDCDWDQDGGIGVKLVDNKVQAIGTQDIIL